MNGAYVAAGALALVGAAIHGGVGEATVVRKLDAEALPRTLWGGPRTTLLYIRAIVFVKPVSERPVAVCLRPFGLSFRNSDLSKS
jgi:hypothetical protein